MENLQKILTVLLENKIDFVIVGGYAAMLHGSSQVTKDIDICLVFSETQTEKLRQILAPFNPVHRMTPKKLPFLKFPEQISGLKNLYLHTDLGAVDILSTVGGVGDFARLNNKAMPFRFYGHLCKLISMEDLIEAKKFMGRPKDIATIKELNVILDKERRKRNT